jgi:hypothetical protein
MTHLSEDWGKKKGLFPKWGRYILILSFIFMAIRSYADCGISFTDSLASDPCASQTLIKLTASGAPKGSIYYWKVIGRDKDSVFGNQVYYIGFDSTQKGIYGISLTVRFPNGTLCNVTKQNLYDLSPLSDPRFIVGRKILCSVPDTTVIEYKIIGILVKGHGL